MTENIVRTPEGPRSDYCRLVDDATIEIDHPHDDPYETALADLKTPHKQIDCHGCHDWRRASP